LEGIGALRDIIVTAVALRVGEMVDGTPFRGMFLRDHTHGVTLEVRKGRVVKRSCYPSKIDLPSKVCGNVGVLSCGNEITGHSGFLKASIANMCAIAQTIK